MNKNTTPKAYKNPYYYGKVVRMLFLFNAAFLFLALPLLRATIGVSLVLMLSLVMVLITLAALTSSRLWWIHILNSLVAVFGVGLTEYYVITRDVSGLELVIITLHLIALVLLFALFFSLRTLYGYFRIQKVTDDKHSDPQFTSKPMKVPDIGVQRTNQELLKELKKKKTWSEY